MGGNRRPWWGEPHHARPVGGTDRPLAEDDDGVMNTSLAPPPAAPAADPPGPPAPGAPPARSAPTPPRRTRNAGHVVAIVVGCLLLLPGLGVLAGGLAAAAGQAWATDDDGFFDTSLERIEGDGVAVATTDLWLDGDVDEIDEGPSWLLDLLDVDMRLRVTGAGPTDTVFVGIARSADVERYLAGSSWSDVVAIDHRTPRVVEVPGTGSVDPPLGEDFWAAATSGAGEQELTWEARAGRWSVVVMNADGAAGVAADVDVGFRSDAVTAVAVTLVVVGGVVVAAAIALLVVGIRGRRTSGRPDPTGAPPPSPLPPPVRAHPTT